MVRQYLFLFILYSPYPRFLYQGREVSYSSVLDHSISARRETLYKSRGFDIEHWMDLVIEAKRLRSEIRKITEDYEHSSGEEDEVKRENVEKEVEEEVSREGNKLDGERDSEALGARKDKEDGHKLDDKREVEVDGKRR